ncbi:MAG: carboxypeptidase regulatory-like domain-containing protein, partial [bacterium]
MRVKRAFSCLSVLTLIWAAVFADFALAGTTGKIAGRIVDEKSGEPLPLTNIILEGTAMGAASDMEGYYVILNVPPGAYSLRASMIGYQVTRVENVRVSIDLTTTVDFRLKSRVVAIGEEITVTAEREMVVKDLTAFTAVVGAEEMEALPITEVNEALQLQAGMVENLSLPSSIIVEIAYWIDGVPVTDVYDGNTVVEVNKDMVQELQVVSGAFNAEYGQAMSGIVNIATKEGSNEFHGSVTSYGGDYVSNHDHIFTAVDRVDPVAIRNIEGSLSGAIVKDRLFFYVTGRVIHFDGWQYGQRRYNPNSVTATIWGIPTQYLEEVAPEYLPLSRVIDEENDLRGFQYVLGSNATMDTFITYFELQQRLPEYADDPDTFAVYYQRLREIHKNGKGDDKYVPMNWSEKMYNQTKLIYMITPQAKLSYNFIYDGVDYRDYDRMYQYNPDGDVERHRRGYVNILKLTHTLSSKAFYTLSGSYFHK